VLVDAGQEVEIALERIAQGLKGRVQGPQYRLVQSRKGEERYQKDDEREAVAQDKEDSQDGSSARLTGRRPSVCPSLP
jgi:hypothetical protein